MPDAADAPDAPALSRTQRRQGQPRLIRLALSGSMNNALLTSIAPLFLLGLEATAFHIGVLATLGHMQKVSRLVGLRYMPSLGKAGLMFWGRIGAVPFMLLLVLLAALGGGPMAVWAALGLIAVKGMIYHGGNTAWWPLVQDNTQGERLGGFLARMRLRQRLLEIGLPLAVGWYLGSQPGPRHFVLPFALAAGALILGAVWIRRVGELPQASQTAGIWQRLRLALRLVPLRRYCAFVGARSLVMGVTFPFWVVVLTDRGLPFSHVAAMTSVMALGNMAGLLAWGRWIDRRGVRPVLDATLWGKMALGPLWLLLPQGDQALIVWTAALYLLWGLWEGGLQLASSQAMVQAVEARYQGEGFALAIYASSLGGGLGGLLGGAVFQWAAGRPLVQGWPPEVLYLAAAPLLLTGVWVLGRRLQAVSPDA